MRVLVTRPREDAAPLVAALEARGHQVLLEPLLTIVARAAVDWPAGHATAQALLATSANGLRAFADSDPRRRLAVFAVGDASARVAQELGFAEVVSAAGDVADLAALVTARLDPAAGPLLHPAAGKLAGDLQGRLASAGFTVLRVVLYDAQPVAALSPACRRALNQSAIDVATFFSPRTAASFAALVTAARLQAVCRKITALCLSQAVAAQLSGADSGLAWRALAIAERPDQEALLARLDALENGGA